MEDQVVVVTLSSRGNLKLKVYNVLRISNTTPQNSEPYVVKLSGGDEIWRLRLLL